MNDEHCCLPNSTFDSQQIRAIPIYGQNDSVIRHPSSVSVGEALPSNGLLGMCRWMRSHFHNQTDYNGVFSGWHYDKGHFYWPIFRLVQLVFFRASAILGEILANKSVPCRSASLAICLVYLRSTVTSGTCISRKGDPTRRSPELLSMRMWFPVFTRLYIFSRVTRMGSHFFRRDFEIEKIQKVRAVPSFSYSPWRLLVVQRKSFVQK